MKYSVVGWCISAVGILQLPIWGAYVIFKQPGNSIKEVYKWF